MAEKIRVLLADDHRSYVEGLTALFRDDDRIEDAKTCLHPQREIEFSTSSCQPAFD